MKSIFKNIRRGILLVIAFMFVYITYFRKATLIVIGTVIAAVLVPSLLSAEQEYPPEWEQNYPLVTEEIKLNDALKLFGRNLRVGVIIDDNVEQQTVRTMSGAHTAISYLDSLTQDFGLNWYFDGSILRIYPIGETETHIIPLKDRYAREIVDSLVELGIYQPRFLHMAGDKAQTLRITAPREYLDLVSRTVQAIELSRQVDVRIRRAGVIVDYQGMPPSSNTQDPDSDAAIIPAAEVES